MTTAPIFVPAVLSFTVFGPAQPQGSARAFWKAGMKHPVITSDNSRLKPWRQEVAGAAIVEMRQAGVLPFARETGVRLEATFYFARPKSAPRRILKKVTKPDVEKLGRGLADALTGIVYCDDAQITEMVLRKEFGSPDRTEIRVMQAE